MGYAPAADGVGEIVEQLGVTASPGTNPSTFASNTGVAAPYSADLSFAVTVRAFGAIVYVPALYETA